MPEPTAPETANAPEAEAPETTPTMSLEDMTRELDKTRKEAARYRTRNKQLEEAKEAEAEAKRLAEQTLEQKYQELEKKLQAKEAEAETVRRDAQDRIGLAGRVTDLDYAVYKLNQDPKYRKEDGAIDVDALLKDAPALAITPTPKPGPAPTSAGGEPEYGRTGMNQLIRTKAGRP